MTDRVQTAHVAAFARPLELLDLLLACTNRSVTAPHCQAKGPTGLIARKWYFLHESRELLEYIFHVEGVIDNADPWNLEEGWSLESSSRQDPDDLVILDLLRVKSEMFLQAWQAMTEDRSHHIPTDILQILSSFCIVTGLYGACLPPQLSSRLQDLQKNCHRLWSDICKFLSSHDGNFIQPCLEVLSPLLAPMICADSNSVIQTGLYELIVPFAGVLEQFRQGLKKDAHMSKDPIDLDDQLMSHGDKLSIDESIFVLNRELHPFPPDHATLQRCATIQLSIYLNNQSRNVAPRQSTGPSLTEYLTNLDGTDLLSAQRILPEVFRACSKLERSELLHILEDVGEKCLQSYEMERCETSHGLCISMMTILVDSWTSGQNDALEESAMDLYNWFMDVLLARKKASPKVYIALAQLIQTVFDVHPSYGSAQSLPSPRTTLFKILQEGDIQVKFSTARFVPKLFQRFLLQDHDAIFDDVLESLPRDPDWTEGIALRLFVLSRLASEWHTLLRRSIYHMFETPAQVPASLWYAGKCMAFVFKTLGLHDARQLFRLFSSQIIYTWTETQTVMSMPFSIFGYSTLKDMLRDVKDEVVGQMIMRAKEQETVELAEYLAIPHLELLAASFHKAEAYSIARDISTPPGQGSQPHGVEIRLRKMLGADGFMTQIEAQFPQIIASLFKSLDHFDQIQRAFSKRPNFRRAFDIHTHIAGKSASNNVLPANQQPSFRARYLLDELEFLCKRTGFELELIWTPALASFVFRSLLESIHPALGSLHACSVIRKIRILLCLTEPVMLQDYPLEMGLHALRPFLIDVHCSEDVLGIVWFLLEGGKSYLKENPGFTAGIAVSMLVTLRKVFSTSPESTTQESQFRMVLSNSQKLHQWLGGFLDDCCSPSWNTETRHSFSRLVKLAQQLSPSEDCSGAQNERELVFEVLKDRVSAHPLLTRPISDLILSLLCPEFKRPLQTGEMTSNDAADPALHIVPLWHTLHHLNGGAEYRLWAAQVIGRSFAATGKVNEPLLREQDLSLFEEPGSSLPSDVFCHSKARTLLVLCDMLQSQTHLESGLIERTLQLIISQVTNFPEFQECGDVVPESLMKALIWHPYACPDLSLSTSELDRCNTTTLGTSGLRMTEWARNTALFLCNSALDDPVIGPLRKILNAIPGLAAQLLPYIVHDVLLAEKDQRGEIRQAISDAFQRILSDVDEETVSHAQLVINCILYLRNQPKPDESTIVERNKWLDIDYGQASAAAKRCALHKTSLLFLEIQASRVISGSRRSSVVKYEPPTGLLHDVFKNIDDLDLFYGIQQSSSLTTVMERLEYESSGLKNLLFQSAQYDSEIQMSDYANPCGVLKALNSTNLQGIANTMCSGSGNTQNAPISFDSTLQAATSLQQWDIPVSPLNSSPQATVFRAFQSLNTSGSLSEVTSSIDECLLKILDSIIDTGRSSIQLRTAMRALGVMTEISDVVRSSSPEAMDAAWQTIMSRNAWLKTER